MKAIKLIACIGSCLILPSQAMALSCAPAGFSLYETAKQYSKTKSNVIFVNGRFENFKLKKQKTKPTDAFKSQNGQVVRVMPVGIPEEGTALFKGTQKTRNGEKKVLLSIKLQTTCVASWCGGLPTEGDEIQAALFKNGKQYELVSGPCSPNHFSRSVVGDWQRIGKYVK